MQCIRDRNCVSYSLLTWLEDCRLLRNRTCDVHWSFPLKWPAVCAFRRNWEVCGGQCSLSTWLRFCPSGCSSSVSKHLFSRKSNDCSCRWRHLGLQVARRRASLGSSFLWPCRRLFGAMPSHSRPSPCVRALFAVASSNQRAVWLFLARCVRIWERRWGHVASLETSSSVSKHPFSRKSNGFSCRWGHLGLQVARRRASLGSSLALRGGCAYLELCRFQVTSVHLHVCVRYLQLQAQISEPYGCSLQCACACGRPQNHEAGAALAR